MSEKQTRLTPTQMYQLTKKIEFYKKHIFEELPTREAFSATISQDLKFEVNVSTLSKAFKIAFPKTEWPRKKKDQFPGGNMYRRQISLEKQASVLYEAMKDFATKLGEHEFLLRLVRDFEEAVELKNKPIVKENNSGNFEQTGGRESL